MKEIKVTSDKSSEQGSMAPNELDKDCFVVCEKTIQKTIKRLRKTLRDLSD